jgi:gamma-glutamyltranspeptidase / glutathione hydrolase
MYLKQTTQEVRSRIKEFYILNAILYNLDKYRILTDSGTSAAIVSNQSRLTITITSTVNTLFGSQLMALETSVIMNNEMNGMAQML